MPLVALLAVAEPVLAYLGKCEPRALESVRNLLVESHALQKAHVLDDLVVQPLGAGIVTVEEQEWVYEERQIIHEGYVERAVGIQRFWRNREVVAEVDVHTKAPGPSAVFSVFAHEQTPM